MGSVTPFLSRPSVLSSALAPKPWGWEKWLTSTRPEAPATLEGTKDTLGERIAAHPEALGEWTRRLFGDSMPLFAKLIHTNFPSRVHVGFRRKVERGQLLAWLEKEQDLLRALLGALRFEGARAFADYQSTYAAWATRQALASWRQDDDASTVPLLRQYVDASFDLRAWLRSVRDNRAAFVDTLNEIDLGVESGHLLMTGAGVIHAIFGLSHQTHPKDRARAELEKLFGSLADRDARGAPDAELARTIDEAGLPELRAANHAPPKNEAWFPATVDGADVLVEPQQTSDTTYSLADFYTPLTWGGDRARFRKGAAASGLSRDQLAGYLADVDFEIAPMDSFRRLPKLVPGASRAGAEMFCLLDEPTRWPFFTVYQLELTGSMALLPPPGVFQELVVTRGRVGLGDAVGSVGELTTGAPGFVPATLNGSYTLSAREPSTVLVVGVPGARGGAPRFGA